MVHHVQHKPLLNGVLIANVMVEAYATPRLPAGEGEAEGRVFPVLSVLDAMDNYLDTSIVSGYKQHKMLHNSHCFAHMLNCGVLLTVCPKFWKGKCFTIGDSFLR